ncbi:MAG: aromatic-L-amino-acid decarboxylase [Planctomycetota bacterium]|jgi:aromatic-L-amino-acid decarboxylase
MESTERIDELRARLSQIDGDARALEESPSDRQALTERVLRFTEGMLNELEERPVWDESAGARAELLQLGIPEEPADLDGVMDLVQREIDGPGLQPASGGHLGYIAGGGIYAGALGDLIAAVTNRYAGVHYAGPGAVHLENMLLRWLCGVVGYPAQALGTLTSGGSIATLVAVVAARDAKRIRAREIENSVIYATAQAHHCVEKAIAIAGLAEAHLRHIPMDAHYRMDARALEAMIEIDRAKGLRPFLLVGTAGTTDTGAIDPIASLADIAEREELWLHIDAAYGGVFLLVDSMRERFRGIERADSVVIDPHKGLFLPYGTGAVLLRDPAHLQTSHGMRGAYLQDATDAIDEPSPADLSPELTRHFRGLRLWLPLQVHGLARYRAALEEKLILCHLFYERVQQLGFQVGPKPDLSVAMFRWAPRDGSDGNAFTQRLLKAILDDGRVFLSSTSIDGVFWIRVAVLCFRTHVDRIDAILEVLERETATDRASAGE